MARKKEATFISAVNEHLPSQIHHQSMFTPFSGGTPDQYYEGFASHLWVEYKWLDVKTTKKTYWDLLDPLQRKWIKRAIANHQPVWVVVGSSHGIARCKTNCPTDSLTDVVRFTQMTKERLAGFIAEYCLHNL